MNLEVGMQARDDVSFRKIQVWRAAPSIAESSQKRKRGYGMDYMDYNNRIATLTRQDMADTACQYFDI